MHMYVLFIEKYKIVNGRSLITKQRRPCFHGKLSGKCEWKSGLLATSRQFLFRSFSERALLYIHTKPTIVSVSQKAFCFLFYFYCVYDVVLLKSQMVWELWLKRFSEMGANFCNIVKNPCSVSFPFLLRKEWFFILLHFPKSLEKKPWFSLGTTRTLRKRRKKKKQEFSMYHKNKSSAEMDACLRNDLQVRVRI